jgi:hypothetical protein
MIDDFIATTEPAVYSRARFRAMLKAGPPLDVAQAEAGQAPVVPLRAVSRT